MNKTPPLLFSALCLISAEMSHSQTTLSGDHIVTGDLNVGTTGTTGNILVSGDTGNSAPPGLKVTGDGGVVFTGTFGAGQIPATGAGTRFMWYPKKAAIRAGRAGGEWDDSSIGDNSTGFGNAPLASGGSSVAMGSHSWAIGIYTVAIGDTNVASGWGSAAFGRYGDSTGTGSITIGDHCSADGYGSVGMGNLTVATGTAAIAMGDGTLASGHSSTAMGYGTVSIGKNSTAMGEASLAWGRGSLTAGVETEATSYASAAFGYHNVGGGDPDDIVAEDPLFEIGNGTGNPSDPPEVERRNALTVYKNGNVVIPKRQGDILMGEFGNPE